MCEVISSGIPQGLILGPLFFNILLNDLFVFVENSDLSNYPDDNAFYSSVNDLDYIVLNSGNCYFICL